MGVGHGDALLVENVFDALVDLEVHIPVVLGPCPEAQGVVNGIVPIAHHCRKGSRLQEGIVHSRRQNQGVDDLLGGGVIARRNLNFRPAGIVGGVVHHFRGQHRAVGDADHLIVHGDKPGIAHIDLGHGAGLAADIHIVPGVEGMGCQQRKAAQHIGQHILQGQRHSQCQHTGQRHHAGDINAEAGGQAQAQQQV